jgi:ABC-2 type transport system permease protein
VSGAALRRVGALVRREVRELSRDRFSLALIFSLPASMLVLFTFVVVTEVKDLRLAVFDASGSSYGRELVARLEATRFFRVTRARSLAEVEESVASGSVGALLTIPPGVEERFAKGETAEVELEVDGAENVLAANAEGIVAAVLADFGARVGAASAPAVRVEERAVYNPRLASESFMVPGVLGYLFTFLTVLVAAISIIRERIAGTFEQLLVTPVMAREIIAAKLLVLGLAMLANEGLVVLMGGACFGVWPRGSLVLLFATTAAYLGLTLSLGLVISASAKDPADAVQKTLLVVSFADVSGTIFPVSSMPLAARGVAHALPFFYYLQAVRAIYLAGAGARDIALNLAVIGGYLAALLPLLARMLRSRR